MLSVLAAAAVVASQPTTDPDIRCMASFLVVAGQMGEDPQSSAEDKSGVSAIVLYFFGKVRGRNPKADVKNAIMTLVQSPGYLDTAIRADIERCSAEAEARGKELGAFSDLGTAEPTGNATTKP